MLLISLFPPKLAKLEEFYYVQQYKFKQSNDSIYTVKQDPSARGCLASNVPDFPICNLLVCVCVSVYMYAHDCLQDWMDSTHFQTFWYLMCESKPGILVF
jgi:hypothetical protein